MIVWRAGETGTHTARATAFPTENLSSADHRQSYQERSSRSDSESFQCGTPSSRSPLSESRDFEKYFYRGNKRHQTQS